MEKDKVINQRYILGKKIKSGGFGHVYACKDILDIDTPKVLKIVPVKPGEDIQQLKSEGKKLLKLRHKNIVKAYDYFEDIYQEQTKFRGKPFIQNIVALYIIMEKIEGEQLTYEIGKLQQRKMLRIYEQVRSALQYLRENKIIHRDIAPDNILIDRNGNAVLIDFGIASENVEDKLLLTTLYARGKVMYMSPQIFWKNRCTYESDWWAFGIVLYELAFSKHITQMKQQSPAKQEDGFPHKDLKKLTKHLTLKPLIEGLLKINPNQRQWINADFKRTLQKEEYDKVIAMQKKFQEGKIDLREYEPQKELITLLEYVNGKGVKQLILRSNFFQSIDFLIESHFNELETLDLSLNKIQSVKHLTKTNFPHLKSLNLSFNRIVTVEVFSDIYFVQLRKLFLNNNLIESIQVFTKDNLTQLLQLNISQNKVEQKMIAEKREAIIKNHQNMKVLEL